MVPKALKSTVHADATEYPLGREIVAQHLLLVPVPIERSVRQNNEGSSGNMESDFNPGVIVRKMLSKDRPDDLWMCLGEVPTYLHRFHSEIFERLDIHVG